MGTKLLTFGVTSFDKIWSTICYLNISLPTDTATLLTLRCWCVTRWWRWSFGSHWLHLTRPIVRACCSAYVATHVWIIRSSARLAFFIRFGWSQAVCPIQLWDISWVWAFNTLRPSSWNSLLHRQHSVTENYQLTASDCCWNNFCSADWTECSVFVAATAFATV